MKNEQLKKDYTQGKSEDNKSYRSEFRSGSKNLSVHSSRSKFGFKRFFQSVLVVIVGFLLCENWIINKQRKEEEASAAAAASAFAQHKAEFDRMSATLLTELNQNLALGNFDAVMRSGEHYVDLSEEVSRIVAQAKESKAAFDEEKRIEEGRKIIEGHLKNSRFKEAWDLSSSFVDPEIKKLGEGARLKYLDAEEQRLLGELKKTPSLEFRSSVEIFTALSQLKPENREYAKKLIEEKAKLGRFLRSKWTYLDSPDEMGRGNIKQAIVISSNAVDFGFPYSGAQKANLTLRSHPKYGKDVILKIERGQFLCRLDSCNVTVRFDTGKPRRFRASGPDDNSTEVLFIRDYSTFVAELRKSKTVSIEAAFYQEGERIFQFDVDGLQW